MTKLEYIGKYIELRNLFDHQMDEYVKNTFDLGENINLSNEDKVEILTHGFIDEPLGGNTASIEEVSVAFDYFFNKCNINLIVIFDSNFHPHAKNQYYYVLRGCLSLAFEKNKIKLFNEIYKIKNLDEHILFKETLFQLSKETNEDWAKNSIELIEFLKK
jgi:hypothetical protein